jgi:transglutaminase-like putative cysteine protease
VNRRSSHRVSFAFCVLFLAVAGSLAVLTNWGSMRIGPGSALPGRIAPGGSPGSRALPVAEEEAVCAQSADNMCVRVYTGTVRSVYNISNPGGISGFQDYQLVNYEQKLVGSGPNSIDVQVTSWYYVDTSAPYPVNQASLPGDVQSAYLQPQPGWIQSDDPAIVAKANELVVGATRQAEAVDAILTWVRAHIAYSYSAPANDASSVFVNRQAVCAGFSTVSTALLRAAGIPSRCHNGCATPFGYVTGPTGGWHAWIEAYYPDVGWVASEPQSSANVIDPHVISLGFDQCQGAGTVITRTSYVVNRSSLYDIRTAYGKSIYHTFGTASIPSWDRLPLVVAPSSPAAMLPVADPTGNLLLHVENLSCDSEDWQVRVQAPWLSPGTITGATAGKATFSIDGSGMAIGLYTAPMTAYSTSSGDEYYLTSAISTTLTARLFLVEAVYDAYLPLVVKPR